MTGPERFARPSAQAGWIPADVRPTRMVLVRHGVTEYSVARRFAGRSDLELTAAGRDQAERAAGRITTDYSDAVAVLASPLRRTHATAQAIADRLGQPVRLVDGLVETDFGDWDGYSFAEVRERWPDDVQRWLSDSSFAPPGGESFDTVTDRVRAARDAIVADFPAGTVIVVSHVTPIKTLVRLTLEAPAVALQRMYLAPASITVVDFYATGPASLQTFNDTEHLRVE